MNENFIEFVSGSIGGIAALTAGYPIDTVKTVSQTFDRKVGIIETMVLIKNHGIKTFFRGIGLPFWSYPAINAITFSSRDYIHKIIDPKKTSLIGILTSGAASGGVQLILATPVDVVKIKMQYDSRMKSLPSEGSMSYIKDILKENGWKGLYKGVGMHALRDVPSFSVYFWSYELSKRLMEEKHLMNSTMQIFTAGGIAGLLAWILFIPQDVMKTRIQSDVDRDIKSSFKALKLFGWKSFFKGTVALSVRAVLVNGVTFLGYEECKKQLNKI